MTQDLNAAVLPFPRVDTPPTPPVAVTGQLVGLTLEGGSATALVAVSPQAAVHLGGLLFSALTLVDPVSAEADGPLAAAVRSYLATLNARLGPDPSAGELHALELLRSLSAGVSWTELVATETAVQEAALTELAAENQALAQALAEVTAQLGEARELVAAALVDATPAPEQDRSPDAVPFRTGENHAATHPVVQSGLVPLTADEPAPAAPLNPNPAPQRQNLVAVSDDTGLTFTWLVEKADTPPSGPLFLAVETAFDTAALVAFSWVSDVGAASHFGSLPAAEHAVAALPDLPPVRYRTSAQAPVRPSPFWDENAPAPSPAPAEAAAPSSPEA